MSVPLKNRTPCSMCGKRHKPGSFAEQDCKKKEQNAYRRAHKEEHLRAYQEGTLDKAEMEKMAKREKNALIGELYRLSSHNDMGHSATDLVVAAAYSVYDAGRQDSEEGEETYRKFKENINTMYNIGDLGSYETEEVLRTLDSLYDLGLDHNDKLNS